MKHRVYFFFILLCSGLVGSEGEVFYSSCFAYLHHSGAVRLSRQKFSRKILKILGGGLCRSPAYWSFETTVKVSQDSGNLKTRTPNNLEDLVTSNR